MPASFILLCIQTIILWTFVVVLHQNKKKLTLIPSYVYLAILTIFTHNLSDLNFAIVINEWFFLIASFSFFTTLMFETLFLYLFEGPRAARTALWVILFSSFFYIAVVYLLGFQVDTSLWIQITSLRITYYFWSIFAIILDILCMAIIWELLSKIRTIPLIFRVFITTFVVFVLDAFVFTTGVFGSSELYPSILRGSIVIRLILSVFGALFMSYFLSREGFSEEEREKPKKLFEILNFRSDLEKQIQTLEETIHKEKIAEQKLQESQETYELALQGSGAGVWDWDVVSNKIQWSKRFLELLGYQIDELKGTLEAFKEILYSGDTKRTFDLLNDCFQSGKAYEIEYRLKTKAGTYRWFLASGITKYDVAHKPIRMVGSIIDIHAKKEAQAEIVKVNDRLQNIIDSTNAGTWEWNIQTGEVVVNTRWAEILGYTLEEVQPMSIQTWEKLSHPEDFKKSQEALQMHFVGKQPYYAFESRMKHKNGSWIWVYDSGKVIERDAQGKSIKMFGTHIDITKIKTAADELQKKNEELESVNKIMVDRELKMVELKKEVEKLKTP